MSRAPRSMPRWAASAADVASALLDRLPGKVVGRIKGGLHPVGRLDYLPVNIRMAVDTPWQIYRLGSCAKEPETIRWLETNLRSGGCLYDIGANVGAYSLVAAAIGGGTVQVVAFEPGFANFQALCQNIGLNSAGPAITPLPIALGASPTLSTFAYSDTDAGAARHSWGDNHDRSALELRTPIRPLDDIVAELRLPLPTIVKIDVDGPEREVVLGGRRTLGNPSVRSVLVELEQASPADLDVGSILGDLGYVERERHPRGEGSGLANVIFGRRL